MEVRAPLGTPLLSCCRPLPWPELDQCPREMLQGDQQSEPTSSRGWLGSYCRPPRVWIAAQSWYRSGRQRAQGRYPAAIAVASSAKKTLWRTGRVRSIEGRWDNRDGRSASPVDGRRAFRGLSLSKGRPSGPIKRNRLAVLGITTHL